MTAPRHLRLALSTLVALPVFLSAASAQDKASDPDLDAKRSELDQRYAIGPTPARELGYRIVWQASIGTDLKRVDVVGPDVYALDTRNRLTRLDRNTGSSVWTTTAADANDSVWGVTPGATPVNGLAWGQNEDDRLYVTTDPVVFEFDHATGAILGRQDLERIPSTDVVRFRNYLVFGTRTGQIVWHQYLVGHAWRANQLRGPIVGDPILIGSSRIGAASLGGTLLMLDAKTSGRVWGDKVFDGVSATLAAGGGKVFCAGLDQYLWAFDADRGDVAWRYFTESKLDTPPAYFTISTSGNSEGRVLQWVENEGLVCLQADSGDTVEGKVMWRIPDARGDSVGSINDHAALWDEDAHVLRLVNVAQGSIAKTISLPQVESIHLEDDSIFATGTDGRVIRLDPVG